MTLAEWATAGSAVALVFLTAAYAWQTRLLVAEMRATRKEALQPVLRLTPEVLGVNFPIARITNVGPGHALDISGRLTVDVGGEERWSYDLRLPALVPDGSKDFVPRLTDSEQPTVQALAAERRRFLMSVDYIDAVGRKYHAQGEADWSVVTEHMWGAGMLRGDDPLSKIEKHAERIANSLRHVTTSADGLHVTTYRERQSQSREWLRQIEEERSDHSQDDPQG